MKVRRRLLSSLEKPKGWLVPKITWILAYLISSGLHRLVPIKVINLINFWEMTTKFSRVPIENHPSLLNYRNP